MGRVCGMMSDRRDHREDFQMDPGGFDHLDSRVWRGAAVRDWRIVARFLREIFGISFEGFRRVEELAAAFRCS